MVFSGSVEVIDGSGLSVVNLVVIGDVFWVVFTGTGEVICGSGLSVVNLVAIGDRFDVDRVVIDFEVVSCGVGEAICSSGLSVVGVSSSTNKKARTSQAKMKIDIERD